MQRRRLGDSSLEVPIVSFGAWAIGGWYWGGSDDAAAIAALHAALDAGMDAIDTAPVYGFGRSERVIGEALRASSKRAIVMTKVGLRWDDPRGPVFFEAQDDEGRALTVRRNLRADSIRAEVEASAKRLGRDVLDLVQIHWPDPETPLAESLHALLELRAAGKVREIGVSNFDAAMLAETQRILGSVPLASTQERYSALSRRIERDLTPWTIAHGVGVLAYSPLEQGLLTGKVTPERRLAANDRRNAKATFSSSNRAAIAAQLNEVVGPVASRHRATYAQVVLAATAAQPGITSVLAGARSAEQARENAAAGELALASSEIESVWRGLADIRLRGPARIAQIVKRLIGRA
jgi:aryl-alcohol dehydrogenase-like predicted oxidoreductase